MQDKLEVENVGRIGTVVGRFYAMDRDLRWDRVASAYQALTKGAARPAASAKEAIQSYYDNPTEPSRSGDEFIVYDDATWSQIDGGVFDRGI